MSRGGLLAVLLGVVLAGGLTVAAISSPGGDVDTPSGLPEVGLDGGRSSVDVGSTLPNTPGDEPTDDAGAVAPDGRLTLQPDGAPTPLVNTDDIQDGGPGPDGIPPIDEPHFTPADEVRFLAGREPVMTLTIGADTRAYPLQIMLWHEIVNDTVGDVPVSVTYCPLCNSAFVWERTVGDRVLSFGTSGKLYNSSLVAYDRQTRSLWAHFTGEAIAGELTGEQLTARPSAIVSWDQFRAAHPEAPVLNRTTGAERDYGTSPYPGYDDVDEPPFLFEGETDDRLAAKERVVGVSRSDGTRNDGSAAVAVTFARLEADRVVAFEVDGRSAVALYTPGTASALDTAEVRDGRDVGSVNVISPELDGVTYRFTADDDGRFVGRADDGRTVATIDVGGIVEPDGSTAPGGTQVAFETLPHVDTFWFAWAVFHPRTVLIGGS